MPQELSGIPTAFGASRDIRREDLIPIKKDNLLDIFEEGKIIKKLKRKERWLKPDSIYKTKTSTKLFALIGKKFRYKNTGTNKLS